MLEQAFFHRETTRNKRQRWISWLASMDERLLHIQLCETWKKKCFCDAIKRRPDTLGRAPSELREWAPLRASTLFSGPGRLLWSGDAGNTWRVVHLAMWNEPHSLNFFQLPPMAYLTLTDFTDITSGWTLKRPLKCNFSLTITFMTFTVQLNASKTSSTPSRCRVTRVKTRRRNGVSQNLIPLQRRRRE